MDSIRSILAHKTVPVHSATIWYYFGGITLFLFLIQVVTGILLLFYYRPTTTEAYESVQFIMTKVEFGWLIRSVHSWSANLMILAAFIHMFSVVFLHAYRKPRELTWLSGIALLGLALAIRLQRLSAALEQDLLLRHQSGDGYGRQRSRWIGPGLARILRGGEDVAGATLTRFFALHVAVLPALTTLLLLVHLALVQKHGISAPPWIDRGKMRQMPFFPNFLLRELMAWYGALAVLGSLAAIFPWELGEKADPFASAPAGIRPEWYFLAPFYTLKLIPSHVLMLDGELMGILGFTLLAVWWVTLPFWAVDRQGTNPGALGDGSGRLPDLLSVRVFASRVLPMKPLLAGFFAIGLALAAKDSCLECHSILEGACRLRPRPFPPTSIPITGSAAMTVTEAIRTWTTPSFP